MSRATLIRLVLRLYPEPVRERYGAEVAELLVRSTRPGRDLADVARCALGEWLALFTREHVGRLAVLAAAPVGFLVVTIAVAAGPMTFIRVLEEYAGFGGADTAFVVILAISAVLVCAEAAWFARRVACSFVAPTVTIPVALALGTIAMHTVLVGDNHIVLPTAVWCVAMIALGRSRGWVLVAGGMAALALAGVLYALVSEATRPFAAFWPPMTLAMCTAFTLAGVRAVTVDRRRARTSAPRRRTG